MADEAAPTPEQQARADAEETGEWPERWGPFHRHFANDAIHRDGGTECDQLGTPYRVYVFDPEYLDEHERAIAERVRAEERQRWVDVAAAVNQGRAAPPALVATPTELATSPACDSLDPNRDLVNRARCVHRFHSLAHPEQDGQR